LTVPMVRTPPPVPARTEAPLAIESKPSGAVVFLDGKQVGTTPLTFPLVKVGAHAVRITLEGYQPWSSSVQVSATEPNRVTASLER
jgi:PEGA domain